MSYRERKERIKTEGWKGRKCERAGSHLIRQPEWYVTGDQIVDHFER